MYICMCLYSLVLKCEIELQDLPLSRVRCISMDIGKAVHSHLTLNSAVSEISI